MEYGIFKKKWKEAKLLGESCITNEKLVQIITKLEKNQELTSKEEKYIVYANKKYKAPYGMYIIADFIKQFDKVLEENYIGKTCIMLHIFNLRYTRMYLESIFGEDTLCAEYKYRLKFLNVLKSLF